MENISNPLTINIKIVIFKNSVKDISNFIEIFYGDSEYKSISYHIKGFPLILFLSVCQCVRDNQETFLNDSRQEGARKTFGNYKMPVGPGCNVGSA